MAGHSKWKNIRERKGAQDKKRGKIFTKIATEITVATRLGGADTDINARLRTALLKARDHNMPKDNIERAIKKGAGELTGQNYSEKVYEGYGPGGVAVVIECLTDNVNRTVGDIRHAFTKCGGNLGAEGSVSWMFHKKGQFIFDRGQIKDYDKLLEIALDHGADDVKEEEEDSYEIYCAPTAFLALKEALEASQMRAELAELTRIPENRTAVDQEKAEQLNKLIDWLEDSDDVQSVYHNGDLPNEA